MALREDLVIPQGKSWIGPEWALLGQDGAPVSLEHKTVKAQVRESERDTYVLHEWSTALGNVAVYDDVEVELVGDDGVPYTVTTVAIALTVKPSVSSAWRWQLGVYDVEITDTLNADDVWSVVELSAVRVEPEVTR
jgi:hypothetical protein